MALWQRVVAGPDEDGDLHARGEGGVGLEGVVGAEEHPAGLSADSVGDGGVAAGDLLVAGGGVEVSGLTFALYENLSPGWGYTAIAVALLGSAGQDAEPGADPLGEGAAAGVTPAPAPPGARARR